MLGKHLHEPLPSTERTVVHGRRAHAIEVAEGTGGRDGGQRAATGLPSRSKAYYPHTTQVVGSPVSASTTPIYLAV